VHHAAGADREHGARPGAWLLPLHVNCFAVEGVVACCH
jgi:hypothetical protein